MHWRRFTAPLVVALVVLGVGTVLVVVPILNADFWRSVWDPTSEETTRTVKTTEAPDGTTVETTETTVDDSALEQALSASGGLLLRIGLVAIAAFLAGAATQRILIGQYQLKAGPIEIPAEEAAEGLEAVKEQLEKLAAAVIELGETSDDEIDAARAAFEERARLFNERLQLLDAKIEAASPRGDGHRSGPGR